MKIISFFSFKGGIGRTALLTNLGAYWASQGKVVVLMDLDSPIRPWWVPISTRREEAWA